MSIAAEIENPKGQETGQETIEVLFKTSEGDTGSVVVAPGKSATRTFEASEGFTVFVFSAALGQMIHRSSRLGAARQLRRCGRRRCGRRRCSGGGEAGGGGLPKTGPETAAVAGAAGSCSPPA
jgi:hypothetical protein